VNFEAGTINTATTLIALYSLSNLDTTICVPALDSFQSTPI